MDSATVMLRVGEGSAVSLSTEALALGQLTCLHRHVPGMYRSLWSQLPSGHEGRSAVPNSRCCRLTEAPYATGIELVEGLQLWKPSKPSGRVAMRR